MLFNSLEFVAFFVVVYGLYAALSHRWQNRLLLGASYFFYGFWDWRFLSLLLLSTAIDYAAGVLLDRNDNARTRKLIIGLSVTANLGMLAVFKYCNFFAAGLVELFAAFGVSLSWHFLEIVLPVGISFYTFQSMSYAIDVYRRRQKATTNFFDFALFVSFFPQLVAGPIERARDLLPQISAPRIITFDMVRQGAWFLLFGFFKKTVVADNLAVYVQQIYEQPMSAAGLEIALATYAGFFMVYADFSGYSDIAKGLACLMGFQLTTNFRTPYFSPNPRVFWQRWHISLEGWFRDYCYGPLKNSRLFNFLGSYKRFALIITTFTLVGLWHGAASHFVLWGFLNGLILAAYELMKRLTSRYQESLPRLRLPNFVNVLLFFHAFWITAYFFLVRETHHIPILWHNMIRRFTWNGGEILLSLAVFVIPMLALDYIQHRANDPLVVKRWPAAWRFSCYAVLLLLIFLCGETSDRQFVYFQF